MSFIQVNENNHMTRTVESTQLGLYFYVGPAELANDYEASSAIHYKAAELVYAQVLKLPGWNRRLDDNGFPTTATEGHDYPRAELCEPDGELCDANGRLAHTLFFHAAGDFPLDLAIALKAFCLEKYKEAAGGLDVEFAQAKRYIRWSESKDAVWAEVQ